MIKVTAGKDEPERCNQAFTVAATAVASGVPVSLWLTGRGGVVRAARPGGRLLAAARRAARRPARVGARPRHGDRLQPVRGPPGHHAAGRDRRGQDRGRGDLRRRGGRRRTSRRSSTERAPGLVLSRADRGEALGAQPLRQFLGLRRQRRQRPGGPVAAAGRRGRGCGRAPGRAGTCRAPGPRRRPRCRRRCRCRAWCGRAAGPRAEPGDALVVLEAGQPCPRSARGRRRRRSRRRRAARPRPLRMSSRPSPWTGASSAPPNSVPSIW